MRLIIISNGHQLNASASGGATVHYCRVRTSQIFCNFNLQRDHAMFVQSTLNQVLSGMPTEPYLPKFQADREREKKFKINSCVDSIYIFIDSVS